MNIVAITGNLVRDPETKQVGGNKVVSFSIANDVYYKDKNAEKQSITSFVDCEAWGQRGAVVENYYHKGKHIIVEGALRQNRWESKEGDKRSKHIIVVDKVDLGPKTEYKNGRNDSEELDI